MKRNMRYCGPRKLAGERLEDRWVLAGNVTAAVVGGELRIRGDNADNQILIQDDAVNFIVTGVGTMINSGPGPALIPRASVTGDIDIEMRRGADSVDIALNEAPAHNVEVDTAQGNDFVFVHNGSINKLEIETGDDNDGVRIASVSILGKTEVETGKGNDDVQADNVTFTGDVEVETGDGDDNVLFRSGETSGDVIEALADLEIETGKGNDDVNLINTNIVGNLEIETGKDVDRVGIGTALLAGLFTPFPAAEAGPVTVDGDTEVETGDGNDEVRVLDSTLGDGAEDETEFETGDGEDFLEIVGSGAVPMTINGKLEIELGDGNDRGRISGTNLNGDLEFEAGKGNDQVGLRFNIVMGDVDIELGKGDDTLKFFTNLVSGDFRADGGPGTDTVDNRGGSVIGGVTDLDNFEIFVI